MLADATEAVETADVVLTVLFDADATRQVMADVLPAMEPGAVWVQSSTVGIDAAAELGELAQRHGVGYVDAPVLGTKKPAEDGTLVVLAAAADDVRDKATPVLDAIGARTVWLGERAGDGHRLKLTANSWVLSLTAATAQAVAFARDLGIDPRLFLDAIRGGATDSAYGQLKGAMMLDGNFAASFTVDGAVKDTGLIADAMRTAGTGDELMAALHGRFRAAAEQGHGEEDMAAVLHGFAADA